MMMAFQSAPEQGQVVFVGDSITAYWDLWRHWPNAVNAGVPGEDPRAILDRMDALLAAYPHAVAFHILAGTNHGPNLDAEVGRIKSMGVKCAGAGIPFMLCQIPPRPWLENAINAKIVELCAAVSFSPPIDYYTPMRIPPFPPGDQNASLFVDGTHPNSLGYDVMVAQLESVITARGFGFAPRLLTFLQSLLVL